MYFFDEFYLCQVLFPLKYAYMCFPMYLLALIYKSQEGFLVSNHLHLYFEFNFLHLCFHLHCVFYPYLFLHFDFCGVWFQWCGNLLPVVQKQSCFFSFTMVLYRVRLAYMSFLYLFCRLVCFTLSSWDCMHSTCFFSASHSLGVSDILLVPYVSL